MKKHYMKPAMTTHTMPCKQVVMLSGGPGAGDQQNPTGPGARAYRFDEWDEEEGEEEEF